MSAYTLEGYLVALKVRTARTILVEGPSDKTFIDRLLSDLDTSGRIHSSAIVVDTTQLVRAGLGAREIVEQVHARAADIRSTFAGFVDREFREFDLAGSLADQMPAHRVIDTSLFWTRGHSVENYFFTTTTVIGFLRLSFAHIVTAALIQRIQDSFPELLAWTAALSVAAHESTIIDRLRGLVSPGSWTIDNNALRLVPDEMVNALAVRGVTAEQLGTFTASLNRLKNAVDAPGAAVPVRWMIHGHIGTEAIWSAIAHLATQAGAVPLDVAQIATGYREIKFRNALDQWATVNMQALFAGIDSEVPNQLLAWCTTTTT